MVLCSYVNGQQSLSSFNTYSFEFKDSVKKTELISPKRVLLRSAVIPGWGQLTNKQYWKLPIIYAGLGACIYFIYTNDTNYKNFREAYILRTDDDPLTVDQFDPIGGTAEYRYSSSTSLQQKRDAYRRNLELSILITSGFYLLNLVDAYVGAHLREFDISDDLSLKINLPTTIYSYDKKPIVTSGLTLIF